MVVTVKVTLYQLGILFLGFRVCFEPFRAQQKTVVFLGNGIYQFAQRLGAVPFPYLGEILSIGVS